MLDSYYDVAQICENGHLANVKARTNPVLNQDHCDKCGVPTIMACPSCQTEIRGIYRTRPQRRALRVVSTYTVPSFCYK